MRAIITLSQSLTSITSIVDQPTAFKIPISFFISIVILVAWAQAISIAVKSRISQINWKIPERPLYAWRVAALKASRVNTLTLGNSASIRAATASV